jgi:hypothetical protein
MFYLYRRPQRLAVTFAQGKEGYARGRGLSDGAGHANTVGGAAKF